MVRTLTVWEDLGGASPGGPCGSELGLGWVVVCGGFDPVDWARSARMPAGPDRLWEVGVVAGLPTVGAAEPGNAVIWVVVVVGMATEGGDAREGLLLRPVSGGESLVGENKGVREKEAITSLVLCLGEWIVVGCFFALPARVSS